MNTLPMDIPQSGSEAGIGTHAFHYKLWVYFSSVIPFIVPICQYTLDHRIYMWAYAEDFECLDCGQNLENCYVE